MSAAGLMSTSPTDLLPVSVKLLSVGLLSPPPRPRAIPMRSQARNTHTAATRNSNRARRQHDYHGHFIISPSAGTGSCWY